ncbi:hypothetical protein CFP56_015472 [Quercus suber]|uniref:Uncharacterized protein n=1 Tax=Quercus suber TaxID=58331 RepID=A0AAW0KR61_QUESU
MEWMKTPRLGLPPRCRTHKPSISASIALTLFLQNFHINPSLPQPPSEPNPQAQTSSSSSSPDGFVIEETNGSLNQPKVVVKEKKLNRTAELAASTGGVLALAVLCNKAHSL